jgi:hypothetical protein
LKTGLIFFQALSFRLDLFRLQFLRSTLERAEQFNPGSGASGWTVVAKNPTVETYTASVSLVDSRQDFVFLNSATPISISLFLPAQRQLPIVISNIGLGAVTISSSALISGDASFILKKNESLSLKPSGGSWWVF